MPLNVIEFLESSGMISSGMTWSCKPLDHWTQESRDEKSIFVYSERRASPALCPSLGCSVCITWCRSWHPRQLAPSSGWPLYYLDILDLLWHWQTDTDSLATNRSVWRTVATVERLRTVPHGQTLSADNVGSCGAALCD